MKKTEQEEWEDYRAHRFNELDDFDDPEEVAPISCRDVRAAMLVCGCLWLVFLVFLGLAWLFA